MGLCDFEPTVYCIYRREIPQGVYLSTKNASSRRYVWLPFAFLTSAWLRSHQQLGDNSAKGKKSDKETAQSDNHSPKKKFES
ncbi:hypothetical protein TNCT_389911 [Trichonephila clavata]|uniref:Uncharacterized protein n=1 Tax=Trichonephila clavata TaxID=2740835 RepID=A0A8X6LCM7_TRICU|nr:hypothetical protein TNCT_389911 [Trichonephila clavata]